MLPEWVHSLITACAALGTTITRHESTFATAQARNPRWFDGVSTPPNHTHPKTADVGDHDPCRTTLRGASSVITLTSAHLTLLQMKRVAAASHDIVHTLRARGAVRA